MTGIAGPFDSEREASAASLWAAFGDQAGSMRAANLADLSAECGHAGVRLGAYDRVIVEWLAGYEPSTVAVVCGLIHRARQAAGVTLTAGQLGDVLDALTDAAVYRRRQAGEACADCDTAAEGLCPDHQDDYDTADAYDDLARLIETEAGR